MFFSDPPRTEFLILTALVVNARSGYVPEAESRESGRWEGFASRRDASPFMGAQKCVFWNHADMTFQDLLLESSIQADDRKVTAKRF